MTDSEFQPGVSDPGDFPAQAVADALAASDAQEAERVKALEESGKGRKTILEADPAPSPTEPTAETLAALDDSQLQGVTEAAEAEAKPELGSTVEPDGDVYPDNGYGYVVVSTDGLPTDHTEAAEAAKVEAPVVFA